MNTAAGCLQMTVQDDGGGSDAFVVLLSDDRRGAHHCRRPFELELQHTSSVQPPCVAYRQLPPPPSPSPPPPPPPPVIAADAYKTRPLRKDRGAFVVLPEPRPPSPAINASSSLHTAQTQPDATSGTCTGRVSPFRGNGFKTPENGRSRAASPCSEPLRRQSSEPRISGNRQRHVAKSQRLSVSTKDLSRAGSKPTTTTYVNDQKSAVPTTTATAAAVTKSSPRKKLPTGQLRNVTTSSKSPVPDAGSPKTPRRSQPPAKSPAARPVAVKRPPPPPAKSVVNRPPQPVKSSPRLPKKRSMALTSKTNAPPLQPSNDCNNNNNNNNSTQPQAAALAMTTITPPATLTTTSVAPTTTTSASVGPPSSMTPTITTSAVPQMTTTAPVTAVITTAATPSSVTASTSATAIATTHATNAVASPVVTGGPIVSAAPPPAAIAASTLRFGTNPSMVSNTLKPEQDETPSREQLVAVVVENGNVPTLVTEETPTVRKSIEPTTTTPPLSYELQEIVVEPEMENQSGRTTIAAIRMSDVNNTSSNNNNNSNNGHKTVAWARQSEKIIVATDVPARSTEMVAAAAAAAATGTAYPVYKRFARKLLCNSTDDSVPGGQMITQSATTTTTVTATKADGRSQNFWAALWKRRPRLSSRWCYGQKKTGARQLLQTTKQARKTTGKQPHGGRRPRRSCCCGFFGKSRRASSSTDSIGALGISPPPPPPLMTNNTFCGKLLRWSTCCGYCHAVPKLFGRVCCCRLCCGADRGLDAPKKSPGKRSLFKCCTGCCSNKPTKLDAVLVDHTSSVMKGAIPVLPMMLAWFCLVFNVIIPGAGTFSSGLMCLCVGKPRFSVNDNFQSRMGAFCVNFIVAVAQLFTVLFCLVGWGWSIWWGVIMIKIAKKYQKIKVVDHPVETPIAIDQNHQI